MSKVTINKINTPFLGDYTQQDLNLIPSFDVISQFVPEKDNVEFSIYNEQGLLEYIDYNYTDYTVTFDYNTQQNAISTVNVDVEKDVIGSGYEQGNYTATYNFFRNQLLSSFDNNFYIKQISSDRTEVRIANNNIENEELENAVNQFETELSSSAYFEDFQINLGNNNIFTANNILIDTSDSLQYTVLIKLYEPLEEQFTIKDTLWITTQTSDKVSYQVSFEPKIVTPPPPPQLKGPNFDIPIKDVVNNSTTYQDLDSLFTTVLTSSYNELQGVLVEKGITVNVNYSDFNNFVYFSSAEQRVRNFYYKVGLIEEYNNEINLLNTPLSSDVSSSLAILEAQKKNIIENFDGYEKYQYYSSGSSDIYPKNNRVTPYSLYGTGSAEALNWLASQSLLSSNYDLENPDRLVNTLPNFIVDNTNNTQYLLFTDMIGQHFDNIWIYTKDISNRFNADNRLNYGISKDIIADAIRSMGVNLYQNNFSSDDLFLAFASINRDQTNPTLPLYTPYTGNEEINTFIPENYQGKIQRNYFYPKGSVVDATASPSSWGLIRITQDWTSPDSSIGGITWNNAMLGSYETNFVFYRNPISLDDTNKEIYKRIYHNLPYLLKKKGSIEGLRALINCYGIPDTILRISEFGGKDKTNSNDWDYFQNKFNYAYHRTGSSTDSHLHASWSLNDSWSNDYPTEVTFRFKPDNILPSSTERSVVGHIAKRGASSGDTYILLEYTGSGYSSSSYSGSIPSASNAYASLYITDDTNIIGTTSAPFYNGNWWTINIRYDRGGTNTIRVGESIYNGNDGFKLGYTTSSNMGNLDSWETATDFYLPLTNSINDITVNSVKYYPLSGAYQELRYNKLSTSDSVFYDFVLNPYSIEGTTPSSSAENIVFRAPLGSDLSAVNSGLDLNTGTLTSIHPKVTGSSFYVTNSFANDSNYFLTGTQKFITNREFIYHDQPAVGIKNRVSKKIKPIDNIVPSGNVLTPYRTIQQRYPQSESYTRDINYLEVAFSPQNEINDDINSSFGYFNIGEYIGDPRQVSESNTSYQDLDKLRDNYFQKYYKSYDWKDYIRLIKYFDNSLFKMIKDFTPAKTSVSTGVVVKQHLLERNKHKPAQIELSQHDYSGSITSSFIEGANALNYPTDLTLVSFKAHASEDFGVNPVSTPNAQTVNGEDVIVKGNGGAFSETDSVFTFDESTGNIGINSDVDSSDYNRIPLTVDVALGGTFSGGGNYDLILRSSERGDIASVTLQGPAAPLYGFQASFKTVYFTSNSETFQTIIKNTGTNSSITYVDVGNKLKISKDIRNTSSGFASNTGVNQGEDLTSYLLVYEDTTQSHNLLLDTKVGIISQSIKDYREFYNGEFIGEDILVTDGKLNVPVIKETNASFLSNYTTVYGYRDPQLWSSAQVGGGVIQFLYLQETAIDPRDGFTITNEGVFNIRIHQNDDDGNDRSDYFNSLLPGDVITLGVINSTYIYPGTVFEFVISSIVEVDFGVFGSMYEISFSYSNATYGDWQIGSTLNGSLPSFDLQLINDDSTNQFQGFLGENSNPLYNNISNNRSSVKYMDVDYSSGNGILQPTNYIQILSGSAIKATIPDSNYSQKGWVNGRYNGTRISSEDFNSTARNQTGLTNNKCD